MIELTKLSLKNFMSYLDSELNLKEYKGLVLVEGSNTSSYYSSNGSGKSTILEGIVYALTGNTLRGVSVNDVVNRNTKKNTRVSLEFLKDNVPYTIVRYRKDKTHGDSLFLYKEDVDISKRVNKETQKYLEDILGISYKILVSTILLGEGLSSRFTQLSDPDKKSLIESTLNLNYDIKDIRSKANDHLNKLKLDLANLEGQLTTLRQLSTMDVTETKCELQNETERLKSISSEVNSIKEQIESVQATKESIDSKMTLIKDSINTYESQVTILTGLREEYNRLNSELIAVESAEVPHCTLCKQALTNDVALSSFKSNHQAKMNNLEEQINEIEKIKSSLPDINLMRSKLESLSLEATQTNVEFNRLNTQFQKLNEELWSLQFSINQMNSDIENYNKSVDNIAQLEQESTQTSNLMNIYDYFYKLFAPTGIIVNILSDAISYINTRLSTYSEILLEKDYRLHFVKGKLSLVDSKGSTYQSLSNGEKRRLDISIQFSLHDYVHKYCGLKVDTIFIDEILDTLDDVGTENIIDVLRLKLEYCNIRSVYVITHNNELKSKFDQVVTVLKDEYGNSKLISM